MGNKLNTPAGGISGDPDRSSSALAKEESAACSMEQARARPKLSLPDHFSDTRSMAWCRVLWAEAKPASAAVTIRFNQDPEQKESRSKIRSPKVWANKISRVVHPVSNTSMDHHTEFIWICTSTEAHKERTMGTPEISFFSTDKIHRSVGFNAPKMFTCAERCSQFNPCVHNVDLCPKPSCITWLAKSPCNVCLFRERIRQCRKCPKIEGTAPIRHQNPQLQNSTKSNIALTYHTVDAAQTSSNNFHFHAFKGTSTSCNHIGDMKVYGGGINNTWWIQKCNTQCSNKFHHTDYVCQHTGFHRISRLRRASLQRLFSLTKGLHRYTCNAQNIR